MLALVCVFAPHNCNMAAAVPTITSSPNYRQRQKDLFLPMYPSLNKESPFPKDCTPPPEDWILAYSQDQKVSMSASFETTAHGSPSKSLLVNHPCISSLCSFLVCAVAWTVCPWGDGQQEGSQVICFELCKCLRQCAQEKLDTKKCPVEMQVFTLMF